MDDLISIIVPVYNVEKYLRKCIESIINQTYENLEIILIDDGSTDKSGKICDEFKNNDERIIVEHILNNGVSNARNTGLNLAKGNWVVFVDSDDWLDNQFCEKLYKNALSNSNIDIICSGYKRVYTDKEEIIKCEKEKIIYDAHQFLIKLLNVQNGYGFCHMKLIKRNCINNIRFNKDIKVGEDALFNMQLTKNIKKVMILGEPLYNYRFNENSVVRKYDDNYANNYLYAMEQTKNYLQQEYKNDQLIAKNFYNYVSYHILLIAVNYCFNKANKKNIFEQIKVLKNICNNEIFKKAIKNSTYIDLSYTRKITLFTIKHRLYFLTALICRFRQFQFKTNGGKSEKQKNSK